METVKEKLGKVVKKIVVEENIRIYCREQEDDLCDRCPYCEKIGCQETLFADRLIKNGVTIQEWVSVDEPPVARPLEEWYEDYGDVLWWKFPIEEPPYVGSPLCSDWPEYHTHWTPLPPLPAPPKGVQ